jgi:deoxyribodipyrimidine photolyase-related protein
MRRPAGGRWTFDTANRLKYPSNRPVSSIAGLPENSFDKEATGYTLKHFSHHYGNTGSKYPTTYDEASRWYTEFLNTRFREFGSYEDAIVAEESLLNHSLLSPLLNVGLLLPAEVIEIAVSYAADHHIPLNSLVGFIRQISGWREFIRMVYEWKGNEERTRNFWGFARKLPGSFWKGTTGVEPLDLTIEKVLNTGHCHHIERLMVLGKFMLLCEFDPDDVYRWFMELFIDSYDWVMVPNVYGMSQFADGGLMSTKPYVSGSNYLMKMSNYKKGPWQAVWDGLFWRFINVHKDYFMQNPRLGMLVKTVNNMDKSKIAAHVKIAEQFLNSL